MPTKNKRKRRVGLQTAPIKIEDVSGKMPNLHYELGKGAAKNGRQMRFLLHINGACFWLQVGDEMYQLSTKDLMHAMCAGVLGE